MNIKKAFFAVSTAAAMAFTACGSDSSNNANDSDDGLSSSSQELEDSSSSEGEIAAESSSSEKGSSSESSSDLGSSGSDLSSSSSATSASESSSSNEKLSSTTQSSANTIPEGVYYSALPVKYTTIGNQTYYTTYTGVCLVANGTYEFIPDSDTTYRAYAIEHDSLKIFNTEPDGVFETNSADFYTGNNATIIGSWNLTKTYLHNGYIKLNREPYKTTAQFTQDTLFTYYAEDPDFDYVANGTVYNFLNDILGEDVYEYGHSDGYQDIPELGITFTNRAKRSITINIQGQEIEYNFKMVPTPQGFASKQIVTSNGKTCSNTSLIAIVKKETCNVSYKHLLHSSNGNDNAPFSTPLLKDYGNKEEYENCLKEMLKDNPLIKSKTPVVDAPDI